MIDKTLQDLWETKDNIAKEHGYDLDALVSHLKSKSKSRGGDFFQAGQTNHIEQGSQHRRSASRRAG